MIGNGFDVAHGLNTRYSDFYKYYLKLESPKESVQKLKRCLTGEIEMWSDLEMALGIYTQYMETPEEVQDVYFDLTDNLREYLRQEQRNYQPTDKEIAENQTTLTHPEMYLEEEDSRIIKKEIANAGESGIVINAISFNYTDVFARSINYDHLMLTHDQLPTNWQGKVHFGKIVYVHGSIEHDIIVMGVDNYSQIVNEKLSSASKVKDMLVKPYTNRAIKQNFDRDAQELIAQADLIVLYGLSIGATDETWWSKVLWQTYNNNALVIIHWFENGHPLPNNRKVLLAEKTRHILGLFQEACHEVKSDESMRHIKQHFMVALDKQIFKRQ